MKKILFSLFVFLSLSMGVYAQDAYVGEIRCVGMNFAPQGWLECNGQLLSISEYDTLFSLIGTTYGGDGQTTFALPDLRGRVPVHVGQGVGLSPRILGEKGGTEQVTLNTIQIPAHTHNTQVSSSVGTTNDPGNGNTLGKPANLGPNPVKIYVENPESKVSSTPTTATGSGQPHDNMMPYTCMKWIICVNGIYPSPS